MSYGESHQQRDRRGGDVDGGRAMPSRSRGGKFARSELSRGYFVDNNGLKREQAKMASCDGKFGFNSFAAAARTIRKSNRNKGQASKLGPYRCKICGQYHVGSRY